MKRSPQAIRYASKPVNTIPESVWDQIRSSNPEPWREATMAALRGHAKKQGQKLTRTYQALFVTKFGVVAKRTSPSEPALEFAASTKPMPTLKTSRRLRAVGNGRPEGLSAITTEREPIAIIGISSCFPQAADLDAFWQNLADGKDCITEVPLERWDWREIYGDPALQDNKTKAKWGGFLDGMGNFDPLFFGISPKEAELMDPQQRLLMQHVWNVLEDSAYAAGSLAGSNTAIFVGTYSTGYDDLIKRAQVAIEGYSTTGTVPSVGPNRMSYFLDLHGPSEPVETACSSSLVAIRRGVLAIENGECELAIVGGVNTMSTPDATLSFSKAGMLSEEGRCKTFSDQADGYVRGEGVGLLMLKRLSAAERDGDHIYGLIRGTAQNHGGRANSLTAPNPKAQAELIKAAYRQAGIDPRTVGYIEAHGTGTPLGDPVEINGLKMAFKELYADGGTGQASQVEQAHCGIGSVKTNIGHLELAAGVAGVIKVLQQMRHQTLVPSLHCSTINPYIDLKDSPFYIVRERQEWKAIKDAQGNPLPRRAGVSSFGFGGVNAHVVLEEYVPKAQPSRPVDSAQPVLIVLSAKNEQRLQDRVSQLHEAIQRGVVSQDNLANVAYTLQLGRDAMEERLAMIVTSVDELAAKLQAVLGGQTADEAIDRLYRGQVKRNKEELAVLGADEDMALTLEAWVNKGKQHKLLELWVKGLAFDWGRLYKGKRPQRISLPTYPFATERYWASHAEPATPTAMQVSSDRSSRNAGIDRNFFAQLFQDLDSDLLSVDSALAKARSKI